MTSTELIAELRTAIEAQKHPEIMTPAQAANFLGLSEDFLLQHRKRKTGPEFSQPASKIVRYMRTDLIEWLKASAVATN